MYLINMYYSQLLMKYAKSRIFIDGVPDVKWNKTPVPDAMGSFELLLDEEVAAQFDGHAATGRKSASKWK